MTTNSKRETEHATGPVPMKHPPIVSRQDWDAAREKLLVQEKSMMRSHDALAAERRRMPWMAADKSYEFEGPKGRVGLLDLFEGRRQLILTYFINWRGDEAMGTVWSYLDMTALGRQETWEDSPKGYPQTPPYKWWNWLDNYGAENS